MEFYNQIQSYIHSEIEALKSLDTISLNNMLNCLLETLENDGMIYIFGNGGSASTASHFASDFNKGVSEGLSKKFRFICLNDNVATIMSIANDISYDDIFCVQLSNRLHKNDLVIAISGSGNSKNIIKAIEYAKNQNVKTVGLTGYDGGKLKKLADISLHVHMDDMQITEDIHLIFNHLMMKTLRDYLNHSTT